MSARRGTEEQERLAAGNEDTEEVAAATSETAPPRAPTFRLLLVDTKAEVEGGTTAAAAEGPRLRARRIPSRRARNSSSDKVAAAETATNPGWRLGAMLLRKS